MNFDRDKIMKIASTIFSLTTLTAFAACIVALAVKAIMMIFN